MSKKILSILLLVFTLSFTTHAFASLTFTSDAITGTTASSIDLGSGNTLSLNTTNNAPVTVGTGLVTLGGSLNVTGNIGIGTTNFTNFPNYKVLIGNGGGGISDNSESGALAVSNSVLNGGITGISVGVTGGGSGKYLSGVSIVLSSNNNSSGMTGNKASQIVSHNMTDVISYDSSSIFDTNSSVTNFYGFKNRNLFLSSGTLTNNYGVYLDNPMKISGIITNNYGVYIASQTAGTNNYALYSAGGTNYFGGNIGIGTTTPGASSILDISSTTKGVVLPRMTKVQRDAIVSKVAGMAVYQTDNTPGLRVYNGTNWMRYTETAD